MLDTKNTDTSHKKNIITESYKKKKTHYSEEVFLLKKRDQSGNIIITPKKELERENNFSRPNEFNC
jgi:hypothetical protein